MQCPDAMRTTWAFDAAVVAFDGRPEVRWASPTSAAVDLPRHIVCHLTDAAAPRAVDWQCRVEGGEGGWIESARVECGPSECAADLHQCWASVEAHTQIVHGSLVVVAALSVLIVVIVMYAAIHALKTVIRRYRETQYRHEKKTDVRTDSAQWTPQDGSHQYFPAQEQYRE